MTRAACPAPVRRSGQRSWPPSSCSPPAQRWSCGDARAPRRTEGPHPGAGPPSFSSTFSWPRSELDSPWPSHRRHRVGPQRVGYTLAHFPMHMGHITSRDGRQGATYDDPEMQWCHHPEHRMEQMMRLDWPLHYWAGSSNLMDAFFPGSRHRMAWLNPKHRHILGNQHGDALRSQWMGGVHARSSNPPVHATPIIRRPHPAIHHNGADTCASVVSARSNGRKPAWPTRARGTNRSTGPTLSAGADASDARHRCVSKMLQSVKPGLPAEYPVPLLHLRFRLPVGSARCPLVVQSGQRDRAGC